MIKVTQSDSTNYKEVQGVVFVDKTVFLPDHYAVKAKILCKFYGMSQETVDDSEAPEGVDLDVNPNASLESDRSVPLGNVEEEDAEEEDAEEEDAEDEV